MAFKFWTHGSTFSFDSVLVGGLTSIGLPETEKEEVEVTDHDSGGWREFIPGLRDGGTIQLTMRLKPHDDGQRKLDENFNANGEEVTCVLTLPANPEDNNSQLSYQFQAFVQSLGGEAPFDTAGEKTATLRITGVVNRSDISD